LERCTNIKKLDLSHLTQLPSIKSSFLKGCRSLEILILPPNIDYIGSLFLKGCTNVKQLKLSNLTKLTCIREFFLENCINLKTLILPPTIKYIGDSFLKGCTNIKELNLSHLTKLTDCNNLVKNNSLVFVQVNKSMKWKLEHKSLSCLVANKTKFKLIKEKSLYYFITHVILNASLNIQLGIL
jgi:hypothetical protein